MYYVLHSTELYPYLCVIKAGKVCIGTEKYPDIEEQ